MLGTEIANYLASTGIGTVGASIFVGLMPTEAQDAATVVKQYGGLPTTKVAGVGPGSAPIEWPRFQVMVRSDLITVTGYYSAAWTKINSAYRALDGLSTTLSSVKYFWIEALTPPFEIGLDENERVMLVCNFQAARELTT